MADIDPHSPTWAALAAWAEARRERLVGQLVQGSRPDQDERYRGGIAILDELLELTEPPPEPDVTTATHY